MITKTDFDAKLKSISDRITNNKSKDVLLDNELKKIKTFFGSATKTKSDQITKEFSFFRGFFSCTQNSNLVYECKVSSMKPYFYGILEWKPNDIQDNSNKNVLNSVQNTKSIAPDIKNINGQLYVSFNGNYFVQDTITIPNNVINIYCVYELDPIASTRDDTFTVQNALFGTMEITKNSDTSKYAYKGYGICFDEGGMFSEGSINNGRNVLIFGVHESSLLHSNNIAKNIYVMGKDFVQGINDTTLYAEKVYSQNFTQPSKKFVLSLHYNGNNSYLFVNGKQELKFKCKTNQLVTENLCLGNFSKQWTKSESEKTGLYGKIYDFVVDYKTINDVKKIYNMHRYLMTKHDIVQNVID